MPTVHILTKNNQATIQKTLESVANIGTILVGDLGSNDDTIALCKNYSAKVYQFDCPRNEARNKLQTYAGSGWQFYIEPWEVLAYGSIKEIYSPTHVSVLQNKIITKEVRLWSAPVKFIQPVFERIDASSTNESNVVLYSFGRPIDSEMVQIEKWKLSEPMNPAPYYYQSCLLLSQGKYDEFLKIADHYLFLKSGQEMPTIMTRYYYALVQLTHKRLARPALQNINLCLCSRPLMAEFWCLMGDVYYHLLKKFDHAKEFYKNAIELGARRLKSDLWPMDISKYSEYPNKMIESCERITNTVSYYSDYMMPSK